MSQAPAEISPLDSLRDIKTRLLAASRKDIATIWAELQDADLMDQLVLQWAADSAPIERELAVLETINGCAMRARQFAKTLNRLAQEARRRSNQSRLDDLEDQLGQVQALSQTLQLPPTVVDIQIMQLLQCPAGYLIDPNGVFKVSIDTDGEIQTMRVCPMPIFIASRTLDVLTGEVKRQLVWLSASGWVSRIVARRTLMDARHLIALSAYDAPVSSMNAGNIILYLTEFEAHNAALFPAVHSVSRMGWLPDDSFILPSKHISADASSAYALTPPPGFDKLATGWTSGGDWRGWMEAVELASEYPLLMIGLYASAATPLLHILNQSGFVLDFAGETSGGKTTALRFSASVWGKCSTSYPTAMYSWDATRVWIERASGFLHSLPVILDETKRAKYKGLVRDVIYDFCQGQGRGRGAPDGTRLVETWCSIMISSGEGSAVNFSQDAGTRARVLPLMGKPLGNNAAVGGRVSEDIQFILQDHHGHLGPKVIEYLVQNQDNWESFRGLFKQLRQKYITIADAAVARRHAAHLAVLEMSMRIVTMLGVPEPAFDPFEFLVEIMNKTAVEADRPMAALQEIASWCSANVNKFYGRHQRDAGGNDRIPPSGWAGAWKRGDYPYVAITGPALRRQLTLMDYEPAEILERWHGRQWLSNGSGRNRARSVRLGEVNARCYCIKRNIFEAALRDSDAKGID